VCISILLVLIFGYRCVYIKHCTVVLVQFNVLMKSLQVSVHRFITLLTFELSSFRENCFLVLLDFPALAADNSRWTPKSARRQNRENRHTHTNTHTDTHIHTHTQNNYCNPCCACALRVNNYTHSKIQACANTATPDSALTDSRRQSFLLSPQ